MSQVTDGMLVYVQTTDAIAQELAVRLIEEGQWHDLGKGWRARSDKPHTTGMKPHVHVYLRNNELFVINRDGTPSHTSDLSTLPTKIHTALKARSLLESFVVEAVSLTTALMPPEVIAAALDAWQHQRTMHLAIGHLQKS